MSKGAYGAVQAAGMVITIVSAQAVIRSFFDRDDAQLWGIFGWVPGGWAGQLVVLLVLALAGMGLAGWAFDRAKTKG
ncbi:hypothetical protein [Amycolatopsis jejuensis]|uniref:hypothetical protein n=1 Tax=Amycolatopsis jejuensis TaxID=330084 RepID=UPI000526D47A|nr:hypothetical protein [Amycolatopsis jejuensis]